MKRTSRVALIAVVLATTFAIPASSRGEISPEKAQAIRELIKITGAGDVGKQFSDALLAQLQPAFPDVPDSIWTEIATALDASEATDLVIPVYDQHFSMGELEDLIAFYSTPTGQSVLKKIPLVMRESMGIGQRWAQSKAQIILQRLAERGYQPKKP